MTTSVIVTEEDARERLMEHLGTLPGGWSGDSSGIVLLAASEGGHRWRFLVGEHIFIVYDTGEIG